MKNLLFVLGLFLSLSLWGKVEIENLSPEVAKTYNVALSIGKGLELDNEINRLLKKINLLNSEDCAVLDNLASELEAKYHVLKKCFLASTITSAEAFKILNKNYRLFKKLEQPDLAKQSHAIFTYYLIQNAVREKYTLDECQSYISFGESFDYKKRMAKVCYRNFHLATDKIALINFMHNLTAKMFPEHQMAIELIALHELQGQNQSGLTMKECVMISQHLRYIEIREKALPNCFDIKDLTQR